jgi:hypothetical protein
MNMGFLILKKTTTSGICAWTTENPFDDDSGVSGAGYQSREEAVTDGLNAAGDNPVCVLDFINQGDSVLEEFDDSGIRLLALLKRHAPQEHHAHIEALFQKHCMAE